MSGRDDDRGDIGRGERLAAGGLAGLCLGLLIVAAVLHPASDGHGTHTQLGLRACTWAIYFDAPCPTCGMTTSFTHAADGAFLASFLTQPMGFILALGTSVVFWGAAHVAVFGSRLGRYSTRLARPRAFWAVGGAAAAAWAYKIMVW